MSDNKVIEIKTSAKRLAYWRIVYSDSKYNQRVIDEEITDYILTFGAVCIEGAKWIGKTWTSEHHSCLNYILSKLLARSSII